MTWYEKIIAAHAAVTASVRHGQRLKCDRYFVWQEESANDLIADNVHIEKSMAGSTDLFTKQEFDPWREALEASFDAAGIGWRLNSVQYESDTGFWHYEWLWSV